MTKINLEKIRNELNILTLAKDLGLDVGRRNARCFNSAAHKHNDKNYSLSFDARRNRFKCFACDCGGSTIDLYAGVRGVTPAVAMKELWESYFGGTAAGIGTRVAYNMIPIKEAININRLERETLIGQFSDIYEALRKFCGGPDLAALDYLYSSKRGLTDNTIRRFELFSIKDYKATNDFLKSHWSLEELKMSGLFGESGNLIFYKHRLIIPFYKLGRIVFLQGRRLDNEHPKYLHLSDVEVPLFNSGVALDCLNIVLCEGVFDAMALEQAQIPAMAVLGVNNFKQKHAEWLAKHKPKVSVIFDNDDAGQIAANKVVDLLLFAGCPAELGRVPLQFKDATDWLVASKFKPFPGLLADKRLLVA